MEGDRLSKLKFKLLSISVLILISVLTLGAVVAEAADYPPTQSPISWNNPNTLEGYTLYLPIWNNPGILTSNPSGMTGGVTNPIAFAANKFFTVPVSALISETNGDSSFTNLVSCDFLLDGVEYPAKSGRQVGTSLFGNYSVLTFKFNPLPTLNIGNHNLKAYCHLSDKGIIEDYNNVYIVSGSSSPQPLQESLEYGSVSNSADGYSLGLLIDGNPGVVSSTYKAVAAISSKFIVVAPYAYTQQQLDSSSITAYIDTPFQLFGTAKVSSCSYSITNLDIESTQSQTINGTDISYTSLGLFSGSQAAVRLSPPRMSLLPGNYKFDFSCTLPDGKTAIEDYSYIYLPSQYSSACVSPNIALSPSGSQTANSCTPVSETVQYTTSSGGSGGSCVGSHGGSIPIDQSGSFTTPAVSPGNTYQYGITCTNTCGQSASAGGSFTVVQPPGQTTTSNPVTPYIDIKAQ